MKHVSVNKCRLDASVCNNKQHWNDDKCWCECKKLIDKGGCDKGYIWNLINCECDCDKSCDVSENKNKCSSCILYTVLFSIFFTINVEIATSFVYYKYRNHNKELFLNMIASIMQKIINCIKREK